MDRLSPDKLDTLRHALVDWTDFDVAGLYAGRCLGIFGPEVAHITDIKHVFWSAHPVGETIGRFLDALVAVGVLESAEDKYRWNRSFRGDWEI
jgi:hypothetical protein